MKPLSRKLTFFIPLPTEDDPRSDYERVLDALRPGFGDLRIGLSVMRMLYPACRSQNGQVTATMIWQGDANSNALRALELSGSPANVLNVTGPEIGSVEQTALQFGRLFGKSVTFKGTPGNACYLSNSARMCRTFGYPNVSLDQMIFWQTDWIRSGGISSGKPTHFEVNNGKF